ncbi:MAG: lysophospholipid acyltransferase family protein [Bacillota bacterium]|nr:lysophospholipid acyltransferase family protein [Bacillota bacterium]
MSFQRFAVKLCGLVLKAGGLRVLGRENIPEEQAVLVIANHLSYGDPPVLAQAFDFDMAYIAKEEFAQTGWTRRLFGALGAVFLKSGESDLSALRTVIGLLRGGRGVMIFPEGRRVREAELAPFKQGASYIAHKTGVKVIPVALINTADFFRIWKRNIIVNVGQPIELDSTAKADPAKLAAYTALFERRVGELYAECKDILRAEGKL